jgi:hypothetical protein
MDQNEKHTAFSVNPVQNFIKICCVAVEIKDLEG